MLEQELAVTNTRSMLLAAMAVCTLTACDLSPQSSWGFSLPKGDVEAGREAFVKFQCSDCHTIAGLENLRAGTEPTMTLPLGGKTPRVQTYGQLVTSVINPSHVLSKKFGSAEVTVGSHSKMPNYNYAMSVNELIDLVAFLQAQYQLLPYDPTIYSPFIYPGG